MKHFKLYSVFILTLICHSILFGQSVKKEADGIVYNVPHSINGIKKLKLKVWSDNIIQVIATPSSEFSNRESLIITEKTSSTPVWKVEENDNQVVLSTSIVSVRIDKLTRSEEHTSELQSRQY